MGLLIAFLFIILFAFVLFLPPIIAFRRSHPNRWLILLGTLIIGGTGIGWLVMLIAALRDPGDVDMVVAIARDDRYPPQVLPVPTIATAINGRITSGDAVREIEKLQTLKSAGHISEIEFSSLKRSVLNRL